MDVELVVEAIDDVDVDPHQRIKRFQGGRFLRGHNRLPRSLNASRERSDDRGEQLLLRLHQVVDGARVEACRLDDVPHRRRLIALVRNPMSDGSQEGRIGSSWSAFDRLPGFDQRAVRPS